MTTKKKKLADKDMPYTENYPALQTWLDNHAATSMWQVAAPSKEHPQMFVECWSVRGHPVITVTRWMQQGWDIFTAFDDNKVSATLADADARIGLRPVDVGAELKKAALACQGLVAYFGPAAGYDGEQRRALAAAEDVVEKGIARGDLSEGG